MLSDRWENWYDTHRSEIAFVIGKVVEPHPALLASRVVDGLCNAIRARNPTAVRLVLSLLTIDPRMPFGRGLKSRIARALKTICGDLNAYERHTLSKYSVKLAQLEHPPREAREFARLVRSFESQS